MISGVYIIFSVKDEIFYIGSSKNIKKRISTHIRSLSKNTHYNSLLQTHYNEYGQDNLIYSIMYIGEDYLEQEQRFIDTLNPYFNLAKDAKAPMKGKKHTEKTKQHLSKVHKGNKYCLGLKWTTEQRNKILKKKIGSKRSNQTKLKMSQTAKKVNSISRIDRAKQMKQIIDNKGNIFNSLTEAAKFWNISISGVCDILKKRTIATKMNIQFKYKIDNSTFDSISNYNDRKIRGEDSHNTSLKNEDIKYIRKNFHKMKCTEICKKFNITKSTVYRIINNVSWSHI